MDPEVVQAIISTPAEGEDALIATLKSTKADQKAVDAAVAAYRVQKGMKDLVPDATMATVAKAAGYVETAKAVTPNEGDRDDKTEATSGKVDPKAKKKDKMGKSVDMSGLDESARAQVESIFKSHAAMTERAEKLEAVVKSMQDEKAEREYVAKAATQFGHLPMADQELGVMLKSAHDVSPNFAKGFETLLGRMDGMVQKSALLTTMGAVQKGQSGGGLSKIEDAAMAVVQKSMEAGKNVTQEKAVDAVLKTADGDALYREYLQDNPRQRGDIF